MSCLVGQSQVETVGDCYVAVAGLPEARKDHAVAVVIIGGFDEHKLREKYAYNAIACLFVII
jgi:Adenylate and Guanylate cyclase catalytic domain